MSSAAKGVLSPIAQSDVEAVAKFLNEHMSGRFSAPEWARVMRASWVEDAPNLGFMLQADGQVVGALCALYSERDVDGAVERFCNPHSWCVLEPYRSKSVSLVLAALRQDGYHHTMFSPNSEGEEIFAFLGFKPLDGTRRIWPNLPLPNFRRGVEVTSDHDRIAAMLTESERRQFDDHRHFSWLNFVGFRDGERAGFLVYKHTLHWRLPCAGVMHVSDRDLFARCFAQVRRHLLRAGKFTTRGEVRVLGQAGAPSFPIEDGSAKFYRSERLPAEAIVYTYSELAAMDLQ